MQFLSKEQLHRFQHESKLLSRLSHKNIAQIINVGMIEKENLPYIVMEYVDEMTIHQHCQQQKLDFKQIIKLFKQVLDAVQYAHNQSVFHRDIKPENILIPEMSNYIGNTHKNTLIAKNLRAYLLEDLNKLKLAEELYKEMVSDYKNIGDTSNPDYANVLNNFVCYT